MTIKLAKNTSTKSNHSFFSKQTEQSAYLMGLLEADGCIQGGKRIAYSAAEKDQQLVIDTHTLLETNVVISCSTWQTFKKYRWTITSPQIVSDLERDGFRVGKLPKLSKRLLPHWLRGLFDGDGSIFFNKQQKNYSTNIVFGQESLAHEVKDYLNSKGIECKSVYKKTSSDRCWYINLTPKQSRKLGKLIYKNASIFLKRKNDKFKELEKTCRIKGAQKKRTSGKLGELLEVPNLIGG